METENDNICDYTQISRSKEPFKYVNKIYKIIVLGNSGTGKTSFINRVVEGKFVENSDVTISPDISKIFYNVI